MAQTDSSTTPPIVDPAARTAAGTFALWNWQAGFPVCKG
jgi:hypothetical protein